VSRTVTIQVPVTTKVFPADSKGNPTTIVVSSGHYLLGEYRVSFMVGARR